MSLRRLTILQTRMKPDLADGRRRVWFLDTNYDGDAFFVRHAYVTGGDDPYDKLRRSLRADISDEAWAPLTRISRGRSSGL